MNQALEYWRGPTMPQPQSPGKYTARMVSVDMLGHKITTQWYAVEVVEGVPNERNHRLLVKTGASAPKYRSLDCYDWQL